MGDTTQWLEWLFGAQPPGLIWVGGHGDGWKGRTFSSPGEAGEYASWLDEGAAGGVYFRLTLMRPVAEGRGTAEDSTHLVAFGADLDLAGEGHKEAKLRRPASESELHNILAAAGTPEPSAWVHSGGGRYPFWKLAEPIALDTPELLGQAKGVSSALHARIIAEAAVRGMKIDNTRDLARVYRLPGTHNRKGEIPWLARVLSSDGPWHDLASFAERPAETKIETKSNERATNTSSLFGTSSDAWPARERREFTEEQAKAYVESARGQLAEDAEPGNYNNAINAFAKVISHFQAFWTPEVAQVLIMETLKGKTGWPGLDGDDLATIDSAYRSAAGDWQAERIVPPDPGAQALTAKERLRAKMLSRDELENLPDIAPLISGLLDLDSGSWIIGAPGGFKSFIALDFACHVATGRQWQGRRTEKGRVLYIAAEGSKGIRKRIKGWEQVYDVRAEDVVTLPLPVRVASGDRRNPLSEEWQALVEIAAEDRPVLIVVDTQARVTAGMNENDNGEMSLFTEAVRLLKEAAGACVLVVHHTGRDGQDARGASAIDGAQDAELKVERPGGEQRTELTCTILLDKEKDGPDGSKIKLGLKVVQVGVNSITGEDVTTLVIVPHDEWGAAAASPPDVPAWQREMSGVKQEVLRAMYDHAGEIGLTMTQIDTYINERRKEERELAGGKWDLVKGGIKKSTRSSAVLSLLGEGKFPEKVPILARPLLTNGESSKDRVVFSLEG